MSDRGVIADYLAEAAESGLLNAVDGSHYVCGVTLDPLTGEETVFVEYVSSDLLQDGPKWIKLLAALREQGRGARTALIRKPAVLPCPPQAEHHTHYLLAHGRPRRTTEPLSQLMIRRADRSGEQDRVLAWLAKALVSGYSERGKRVDFEIALEIARARFAADGAVMLVAVLPDAGVIGHATLVPDCCDDVTGREYVELVDVLIGEGPVRRVQESLTFAAVDLAGELGRPLQGNVVCAAPVDGIRRCRQIAGYLEETGWVADHDLMEVAL